MNIFCPQTPPYLYQFIDDACHYLKIHRLKRDLHVSLPKKISGCYGCCWGDEESVEIEIARTLWKKPIPLETQLKTLCHEMVHAKQFFRKELIGPIFNKRDGMVDLWKGREFSEKYVKEKFSKYEEIPWEKEAYKLENKIYEYCISLQPALLLKLQKGTRKETH